MGLGIDFALLAVDKFQITTPPDINILKGIYQHEGIILHYFPFNGRLNAIYLRTPDGIELFTIKNSLPQNQIKYLLAYGYACRLLNPPINPAAYVKVIKDHPDNEIDTEAEDFAALLHKY